MGHVGSVNVALYTNLPPLFNLRFISLCLHHLCLQLKFYQLPICSIVT